MEPRWEDFPDGPPSDYSVESLRAEFINRLYHHLPEEKMSSPSVNKNLFAWVELEGMPHYLRYVLTLRISREFQDAKNPVQQTFTLQILSSHGWQDLHSIRTNVDEATRRLKEYANKLFCLDATPP